MEPRDLPEALAAAEQWAEEHVRLIPGPVSGRLQIVWIAQLRADGQLFERREVGDLRKRDSLRARAAREAVRDYVEWVRRTWQPK